MLQRSRDDATQLGLHISKSGVVLRESGGKRERRGLSPKKLRALVRARMFVSLLQRRQSRHFRLFLTVAS